MRSYYFYLNQGGLRGDACPPQYSGVCFLNKQPCGVMPTNSFMTAAFWNLQFANQILTMQKFFFGEMVMPFTVGSNAWLAEMLLPTNAYVN